MSTFITYRKLHKIDSMQLQVLFQEVLAIGAVLILGCCKRSVGLVALFPMTVAPVCSVGDRLQMNCTAPVQNIKWNIFQPNEHGVLQEVTTVVKITSLDQNQMSQRMVNSDTFTFVISSAPGASPLISTLSIDSVSIGLNGTVVRCSDVANPMSSASTIIRIIDTSQTIQYSPILTVSEDYDANNVTITVEWETVPAQQADITYFTKVSPLVPIMSTGRARRRLAIPYNAEYNFSVVAAAPCRPNITAFITLHYANCGQPDLLPMCKFSNDSVPNIVGFDDIVPTEGSIVSFSCPPGLVLHGGPDSAMCTENGEWEPDTRGLMCSESGKIHDVMTDTEKSICTCTCASVLGAALSSTILIFLAISIVVFLTGLMLGNHFSIKFRFFNKHSTVTARPPQIPEYEDIDSQQISMRHQEQPFELKKNVAYGPSKSITVEK